jgi:hypothetical protein
VAAVESVQTSTKVRVEALAVPATLAIGTQQERLLLQTPAVAEVVEELHLPRPRPAAPEVLESSL